MARKSKLFRIEYRFKDENLNRIVKRDGWAIKKTYSTEESMIKDFKKLENKEIFHYRMVFPDESIKE
jgi:hypothetical protein